MMPMHRSVSLRRRSARSLECRRCSSSMGHVSITGNSRWIILSVTSPTCADWVPSMPRLTSLSGTKDIELRSLTEVFARFLPAISLSAREVFRDTLVQLARINEGELAEEARLYLTSRQLRDLATFNFEIGNHTYSHANCRVLSAEEFAEEIDRNKTVLEAASGKKVRSFSVPYGSSADLTSDLVAHFRRSGYEAIFLAEGRANSPVRDLFRLDRVSIKTGSDGGLFSEIEILPRLRPIRMDCS